ncbi:SGNH/GDSL hydrolase family protein [Streptomyces sp. SID13031]|uniref:SGNH/GDSL hydrolase family protein n=1 Tax=Streptomyces sp. SID13031 TaxID=2706046 RepID=UPI0013C8B2D1|nr:SGNH/GDSL hydrolase family protein [Streptomyces sp. SID13031]NEA32992.1 SGNH/GDSL hydrolase family protein [Streptomyces sp. SID13031]
MQNRSVRARTVAVLAATGLLVAGPLTATASAQAAAPPLVYVAMGDSYAAGSLVLPAKEVFTCARSAVNYASLIAKEVRPAEFRDVTCGAAQTTHFANPQPGIILGTAAPQYDALSADTTLVSVGIGGNDIGLVGLAISCVNLLPQGLGKSCKAANTAGGVDKLAQKIDAFAPTYGTVIEQIRQRAPHAKILMVGYPTGIKKGGCWPIVPVWGMDADYLQAALTRLNLRMAQQASAHGATYVDLATPSVGHDMCKGSSTRWIEGLIPSVPTNGLVPLHPNAAGLRNAVPTVLAAAGLAAPTKA